jgi:hypothetical protein
MFSNGMKAIRELHFHRHPKVVSYIEDAYLQGVMDAAGACGATEMVIQVKAFAFDLERGRDW